MCVRDVENQRVQLRIAIVALDTDTVLRTRESVRSVQAAAGCAAAARGIDSLWEHACAEWAGGWEDAEGGSSNSL